MEHWLFFYTHHLICLCLNLKQWSFFRWLRTWQPIGEEQVSQVMHMQFADVQFPGWLSKHNIQILTLKIHISNSVKKKYSKYYTGHVKMATLWFKTNTLFTVQCNIATDLIIDTSPTTTSLLLLSTFNFTSCKMKNEYNPIQAKCLINVQNSDMLYIHMNIWVIYALQTTKYLEIMTERYLKSFH